MSRYRVRPEWPFRYRSHEPGEEFVANLEPDVEARAVSKGTIEVLDNTREKLNPASASKGSRRIEVEIVGDDESLRQAFSK